MPNSPVARTSRRAFFCALVLCVSILAVTNEVDARGAGTPCSRVGTRVKVGKSTLTCAKVGKKRVWRVVRASKANGTSKKNESFLAPSTASMGTDTCRLPDRSFERIRYGSLHAGFPPLNYNFAPTGSFTVALVPIDFADLPGEPNPISRVRSQMDLFSEWWSTVSGGRVSFTWKVTNDWVRLPGSVASIAQSRSDDGTSFARTVFPVVDASVDFSGVRAVYFLLPQAQRVIGESTQGFRHSPFGSNGGYQTAEGTIFNFALAGNYFDVAPRTYWSYWAHETGHMFPLPDLYIQAGNWGNHVLDVPIGPFSGYDMMSSQDGPSRTLSGWLRFLQGWLADDQVWCGEGAQSADVRLSLRPIDEGGTGVKVAMFRVSETKVLAVESRRTTKFDCPHIQRNGVIVYTVDTTLGHGEGFMKLQVPSGRSFLDAYSCAGPPQLDAILTAGQSVSAEGWTITVTASGSFDTIQLSRS